MFPGVQPLLMPIFPDQFEGVTANRFCPLQDVFARMGIRLGNGSIVMKQDRLALASRARARIPEKRKRRYADMAIIPLKLESA